MTPDVRATMIRIQQQIVGHYRHLLSQPMKDQERSAIKQKLDRAEIQLSELLTDQRSAA
jgi:hypothetical protein